MVGKANSFRLGSGYKRF